MLTTNCTEQRIVDLMKHGAKLVIHMSYHPDFGNYLRKVTLEHNGKSILLSHREPRPNWRWDSEEGQYVTVCPIADVITAREDIRGCYAGWQSDFSDCYRHAYEHKDVPVPRWIAEQWATPVSEYDL